MFRSVLLINISDSSNSTANTYLMCRDQEEGDIIWISAAVVSFVFGFPGAIAILLDICQRGRKGTPFTTHDVYMLNLTVIDGLFLFFAYLQVNNYLYWYNKAFDVFFSFLFPFNLCGRPLFRICISLDCYLAVVHPITYRKRKSLTPRVLSAVGVWAVAFAYGLYTASRQVSVITNPTQILFYAFILAVTGFCDFSTFWTLNRSHPGGRTIHPQKKKALQIITDNLVATFISYIPPTVVLLVFLFLRIDENVFFCLVMVPVLSITVVGNAVSPILHLNNLGKLDWLKVWKQK